MLARILALVSAFVVVTTGWLAAPTAVRAAGEWEVTFPAPTTASWTEVGAGDFTAPSCVGTGLMAANNANLWPDEPLGTSSATWGDSGTSGGCRAENVTGTQQAPDDKYQSWRFDPVVGKTYRFTIRFDTDNNTRCWAAWWVTEGGLVGNQIGANQCANGGGTGGADHTMSVQDVAPAFAIGVRFGFASYVFIETTLVEGEEPGTQYGCEGFGSMTGPGVIEDTHGGHDWGDFWYATGSGECRSIGPGDQRTIIWRPTEGIIAGNLYEIESVIRSDKYGSLFKVAWVNATGARIGNFLWIREPNVGTNYSVINAETYAPIGAAGLTYVMDEYLKQASHRVTDLEDAEPEEGPADPLPGIDGQTGAACETPDSFLDVIGALRWLGCVVEVGLTWVRTTVAQVVSVVGYIFGQVGEILAWMVTDGLGTTLGAILDGVVGFLEDIWTGVLGVVDAIVALPGLVVDGIADVLEFLFVPVAVGDAWDDFIAALNGHVPFSWIAASSSFLLNGLTGSYLGGAAIASSMTILGANVAIDFSGFAADIAWLRPILAGLVYFGCAVAVWRMVGRGLGMGSES